MSARRAAAAQRLAVRDLLWPGGARRLTRRPGRSPALLVLPTLRSPRMLVPSSARGAESMLVRFSRSRRHLLAQKVVSGSVRTGLLPLLPVWRLAPAAQGVGAAAIEDHVRSHVPKASAVGVLLGPPRANAKPVLRVFDRDGTTIAYGKVGHNDFSASLVRAETAVLLELRRRPLATLEFPTVLHAGEWHGLEVLLMTACHGANGGMPSWELPLAAMYELAERDRTEARELRGSDYLVDLAARVSGLQDNQNLALMYDRVARRAAATELAFGRWHGDWAPWNMGSTAGRVQLWDWERSRDGVPLGFDIVHFVLQQQLVGRADPSTAATSLLRVAGDALGRWYDQPGQREATVLLYLTEIVARYAADADAGAAPTAALRHRLSTIEAVHSAILGDQKESYVDA
jgi:hypothetical protein